MERLDSGKCVEKDDKLFSVLLVFCFSLLRLNLQLAPVRIGEAFENNLQNLGEPVQNCWVDLISDLVVRVYPVNQELHDRPANLRFTRVKEVDCLCQKEVHQLNPRLFIFLRLEHFVVVQVEL